MTPGKRLVSMRFCRCSRTWLLAALGVAVLGVVVWRTWPWGHTPARPRDSTKVVLVSPRDGATDVDGQAPVQIHFSNGLTLETLTADSVRLVNSAGTPVAARLGSDIEGDVVNLQPTQRLLPRTS